MKLKEFLFFFDVFGCFDDEVAINQDIKTP